MKPYFVVGMILANEEELIRYSVGSLYDNVDQFIIIDHMSQDKTCEYLKELDTKNKITIIKRKWDNSYKNARNAYLDYVKKNIYPKYRSNLYYIRCDADEVWYQSWFDNLVKAIDENPDKEGFRGNFYSFTADYNSLDEGHPTESRVSVFKYSPDISYEKDIHEWPTHKSTGTPLYASPMDDQNLGIMYLPHYQYNHYAWCSVKRCYPKAVNYEKHYVLQGTSTQEKVNAIKPSTDSFWWDKKSLIKFKGKLPEIFSKLSLLPGQENPEEVDNAPKISVYSIIKNGISQDYCMVESIRSALPIADEVIVNLGDSTDGTKGLLHKAFDGFEKVKFFDSTWEGRDQGTAFLRNQSNLAQSKCKNQVCIYLQSDEVIHPKDYDKILDAAKTLYERQDLVGAIVKFNHFDGIPTYINKDSYQEEVRIVKKGKLQSIGDAQSFGLENGFPVMGAKQLLLQTDIEWFHYGWLRIPEMMLHKLREFDKFYHTDDEWREMHENDEQKHKDGKYDYGKKIDNFEGTHPYFMYPRIRKYEDIMRLERKAKFDE